MKQLVLSITGGGTGAIQKLLHKGGASAWFRDAFVPYSKESLDSFLGFSPEKYCSAQTARQMAMESFKYCASLTGNFDNSIGIACTATLAKNSNEREGRKHNFYIARQELNLSEVESYEFIEQRNREAEEEIVSNILYKNIKILIDNTIPNDIKFGLTPEEKQSYKLRLCTDVYDLKNILYGVGRKYKIVSPTDKVNDFVDKSIIYPGSFNPIHQGHISIIKNIANRFGSSIYLEISVTNVDKPQLDFIDLKDRIGEIFYQCGQDKLLEDAIKGVIISNTPRFFDKIWQYPFNTTYIVGSDTANRMFDPKYKVPNLTNLIIDTNSQFIVVKRDGYELNYNYKNSVHHHNFSSRFIELDLNIPNISSTEIRKSKYESNISSSI